MTDDEPSLRGTQPTQLLSLEDTFALLNFNEEISVLNYKTMGGNTFKSILLSLISKITKKHTTFFFLTIKRCHELLAIINRIISVKGAGSQQQLYQL